MMTLFLTNQSEKKKILHINKFDLNVDSLEACMALNVKPDT